MAVNCTAAKISSVAAKFVELGQTSSILLFTPLYVGDIVRLCPDENSEVNEYHREATFKSRDGKSNQRTFDQYNFEVIRGGEVVARVRKGFRELFVRQPVSQEDGFQYTAGDITAFYNPSVNDLVATGYYEGMWTEADAVRHLTKGFEIKRIIRPTNTEVWNLKGRVFVLGLTCDFREKSATTSD